MRAGQGGWFCGNMHKMKLFLNITLVLITIFACYAENVYLALRPPKTETNIMLSIRARQPFNYDRKKELSSKRMQALSQYVPVFNYVPANVEASRKKMEALTKEFLSFRTQKKKSINDFITKIHSELEVEVSKESLTKVLRYRDLKNLLQGILTIEETILQNKILPGPQHLKGKKTIEIRGPAIATPVISPIDDLITLEKAQFSMQQKVERLFWQVNKTIRDPILKICQATLLPNLEFDKEENARRLDKIQRQYPIQTLSFQPGDLLVPFRKKLNEQDVLLLNAFQKQQIKKIYRSVPWSLFTVLFMVIFYNVFLSMVLTTGSRKATPQRPLLSLLILCIFILKGCLLFTPLPIYALPFAFLPLVVISLNQGKLTATGTAVVGTILVSLFAGPQYLMMLYLIFGGLTAFLPVVFFGCLGIRQYTKALANHFTFSERGPGQHYQRAGLQPGLASRSSGCLQFAEHQFLSSKRGLQRRCDRTPGLGFCRRSGCRSFSVIVIAAARNQLGYGFNI